MLNTVLVAISQKWVIYNRFCTVNVITSCVVDTDLLGCTLKVVLSGLRLDGSCF